MLRRKHIIKEDKADWLTTNLSKKILEKDNIKVDEKLIQKAIAFEITKSGILSKTGRMFGKVVYLVLDSVSEAIRDLEFQEKNWNPTFGESYDPFIGIKVYESISKKWHSFKQSQNSLILDLNDTAKDLANTILSPVAKLIHLFCDAYGGILDFIDTTIIAALDKVLNFLECVNAFLCGLINQLLETAAGIVDMLKLLCTLTNKVKRDLVLETLENTIQFYVNNPGKILDKVLKLWDYLKARYTNKADYEKAYNLGEDIVDAVFLVAGIGELIDIVNAITKGFKNFAKWLESLGKRIKLKIKNPKIEDILKWKKEDWLSAKIFRFSDDGEALRNGVRLLQRDEENIFNVITHGSKNGKKIEYFGKMLNAEEYALVIRKEGWVEGTSIRLIVCLVLK